MNVKEWKEYDYTESAVLCFIIKDGKILLIRKKRGLGAGKINGPGGRVEKLETPKNAAIRETREEIGVTPLNLNFVAMLRFKYVDNFSMDCSVFIGDDYDGELIETDEAIPLWYSIDKIPYMEMWEDDKHWLPKVIEGKLLNGYFLFDETKMLNYLVEIVGV